MLQNLLADGERLVQIGAGALAGLLVAWHGAGLVVCAAARARPHRRGLRRLARWSPARVRRWAGVACGASIVLAPVTAYAAPAPSSTTSTTSAAGATDEPFVRAPAFVSPAPPSLTAPIAVPAPVPPPAPAPAPTARTHVVVAGDNLWRIAADEVARTTGVVAPSDRAIVPYWRAVMDANRSTLRSGDPSLIFPGEIVTLPAR